MRRTILNSICITISTIYLSIRTLNVPAASTIIKCNYFIVILSAAVSLLARVVVGRFCVQPAAQIFTAFTSEKCGEIWILARIWCPLKVRRHFIWLGMELIDCFEWKNVFKMILFLYYYAIRVQTYVLCLSLIFNCMLINTILRFIDKHHLMPIHFYYPSVLWLSWLPILLVNELPLITSVRAPAK